MAECRLFNGILCFNIVLCMCVSKGKTLKGAEDKTKSETNENSSVEISSKYKVADRHESITEISDFFFSTNVFCHNNNRSDVNYIYH